MLIGGSEILNPLLCCLGVGTSESPVLFVGSEILNLQCCLVVRNSESSPVLFGGSLGDCLEEFYDSLQTGRHFL